MTGPFDLVDDEDVEDASLAKACRAIMTAALIVRDLALAASALADTLIIPVRGDGEYNAARCSVCLCDSIGMQPLKHTPLCLVGQVFAKAAVVFETPVMEAAAADPTHEGESTTVPEAKSQLPPAPTSEDFRHLETERVQYAGSAQLLTHEEVAAVRFEESQR